MKLRLTVLLMTVLGALGAVACGGSDAQGPELTESQTQRVATLDFDVTGPVTGSPTGVTTKDTGLNILQYQCVAQFDNAGDVTRTGQGPQQGYSIWAAMNSLNEWIYQVTASYGTEVKVRCAPNSAFPSGKYFTSNINNYTYSNATVDVSNVPNTTSICWQLTNDGDLQNAQCLSGGVCGGGGQYGSSNWQTTAIEANGSGAYLTTLECITVPNASDTKIVEIKDSVDTYPLPNSNQAICGIVRREGPTHYNLDINIVQTPTSGYAYMAAYNDPQAWQNTDVLIGCVYYAH